MPDEIGHLVGVTRPMVGHGGDPAKRVTRFRSRRVHLADDRVLGTIDYQRRHRCTDAVTAVQHPNRLQRTRRIGQVQFGCLGEQFDDVLEAAVIDACRVQVHQVGNCQPVGDGQRHVNASRRAHSDTASQASSMSEVGGIASTTRSAPNAASRPARSASIFVTT